MNNANKEITVNKENHSINIEKTNSRKMQLPLSINISTERTEVFKEPKEKSPTTVKDVKGIILSSSKNIIGKVLSPSKDKLGQNVKKPEVKKQPLMTRRELCDPFGSDDEEEAPDNKVMNSKIPEVSKEKCGDSLDINTNDNKLPDLPKPNPVSTIFHMIVTHTFV